MFDWHSHAHAARRATIVLGLGIIVLCAALLSAQGRDIGQWQNQDPKISAWFKRQMQPDYPESSCCGASDSYEADDFEIRDGKFYAIITDTRDDAPLKRAHIAAGTRIEIPPEKLTQPTDDPNITGHGIVFVAVSEWGIGVYCYRRPSMG